MKVILRRGLHQTVKEICDAKKDFYPEFCRQYSRNIQGPRNMLNEPWRHSQQIPVEQQTLQDKPPNLFNILIASGERENRGVTKGVNRVRQIKQL
jgi:hypothetical protein